MAVTLPTVVLPQGVWVDIYATIGIAVGTQIDVQNVGESDVYLRTSATDPGTARGDWQLLLRGVQARNEANDPGEWAIALASNGYLNVRVTT